MAKKRSKTKRKPVSKKPVRKAQAIEVKRDIDMPKAHLSDALKELEILSERKVEQKIGDVERKEKEIEHKEDAILHEEKKLEKETAKIERLEEGIRKEVTPRPLRKLSMKDLNKGIIGAFIGVVAHFAFAYGKQIAQDISLTRATVLIVFSYVLIIILMYETGYREVKERRLLGILPKRATVIYITSIIMILVIFFLFNQVNFSDLTGLYKQIAVTSILASLGAGTADLIGRE